MTFEKIKAAIEDALTEVLEFQLQHGPRQSVSDKSPLEWNRGTSGSLPIVSKRSFVELLESKLLAQSGLQVFQPMKLSGRVKSDLGVSGLDVTHVPIQCRTFPPNGAQTKEIAHTRRDAEILASSECGLAFYVIATSFTGRTPYDWAKLGETLFASHLNECSFSGTCYVSRLQARLGDSTIPQAQSGKVITYEITN